MPYTVLLYLYLLNLTNRVARCDIKSLVTFRYAEAPPTPKLTVPLNSNCEKNECNYGNFVADAMYYYGRWRLTKKRFIMSNYPVALFFPQDASKKVSRGVISNKKLQASMGEFDNIWSIKIKGSNLKQLLLKFLTKHGNAIQVSGVHLMYTNEFQETYFSVRCGSCTEPQYKGLRDADVIPILVNYRGLSALQGSSKTDRNVTVADAVLKYIKVKTTMTPIAGDRYRPLLPEEKYIIATRLSSSRKLHINPILYITSIIVLIIMNNCRIKS